MATVKPSESSGDLGLRGDPGRGSCGAAAVSGSSASREFESISGFTLTMLISSVTSDFDWFCCSHTSRRESQVYKFFYQNGNMDMMTGGETCSRL